MQPEELDEAMKKMSLLATCITEQDRELLYEMVHACTLAALSIDPDGRASVGHRVYQQDLRASYFMASQMLEDSIRKGRC